MYLRTIYRIFIGLVMVSACLDNKNEISSEKSIKDQEIEMTILGPETYIITQISVDMANELFSKYAEEKYGYKVNFIAKGAPFTNLLQHASLSLATRSQEFNLIVSDSQWLGTLAEHHWIVTPN